MRGYKVFNSDWTCRGFQYEVGKTFKEISRHRVVIKPIKKSGTLYQNMSKRLLSPFRTLTQISLKRLQGLGFRVNEIGSYQHSFIQQNK